MDRMWPPSKTCSACGWRNPGRTLADPVVTCTTCGLTLDRDLNAARNIARHTQPVAPGREKTAAHDSGPTQQTPVEGTQVPPPTGAEGRSQRNGRTRPGPPGGATLTSAVIMLGSLLKASSCKRPKSEPRLCSYADRPVTPGCRNSSQTPIRRGIDQDAKMASDLLRIYRNLVHPLVEKRAKHSADFDCLNERQRRLLAGSKARLPGWVGLP
nr:transposase [Streptomyces peucetius]